MKKSWLLVLGFSLMVSQASFAEEAPAVAPAPATTDVAQDIEVGPAVADAGTEPVISENLEFVSGEISAVSEPDKSITVKLYGETEEQANDRILTIKLDETTDITDGEKDRDLKSLTAGTEVDVEYDAASSKATYIFVY